MIYFITDRYGRPIAMTDDPFWGRAASVDTRPKGGEATEIAAPFTGGAVGEAETPKEHP